jgi:hypothetical protein
MVRLSCPVRGAHQESVKCHQLRLQTSRQPGSACVIGCVARSFRENPDERDERAQNHDGLKADRAHDPFKDIGLGFGDIGFELEPDFGDIGFELGLEGGQIRFRGKIVVRDYSQGSASVSACSDVKCPLSRSVRDRRRVSKRMALTSEIMEEDKQKVHQRLAAASRAEQRQ